MQHVGREQAEAADDGEHHPGQPRHPERDAGTHRAHRQAAAFART
ncbi:hypothetical protein [Cellulomonas sp. APG4]|nr:hypothetical protein [Cellulomonas sp. APG4]